ncbi:MAG: Nif3-like dinuclear metal center hexameric protein [Clostridiales bacterium]|nr:Nif3-like dinuclear metal center hexameric protein [Clostridiales bacterium]
MRISDIIETLADIAPIELAEEWDNVGLLAGDREAETDAVVCALELSEGVLDEAVAAGAGLIVTHHPILFRGRKRLTEDDAEGRLLCRLIRTGTALYAMHTNFDNAHPGVNDAMCERLGLSEVTALEHGMCLGRIGEMTLDAFAAHVRGRLGGAVRPYGEPDRRIRNVAVMGGAGGDYAPMARAAGADAFITGECGYHKALDAAAEGLAVLECGHAATEDPAIDMLAAMLKERLPVKVMRSKAKMYY